jgi:endo-1,4-beta-xylanase
MPSPRLRRTRHLLATCTLVGLAALAACGGSDAGTGPGPVTPPVVNPKDTMALRTLAELQARPIGVGAAVGSLFGTADAIGTQYMNVLAREFDVLTPENDMKFTALQPVRGQFTYARADAMVAFAQAHGMRVRGHALAWYQQVPPWVTGGTWTKAESKALLDDHIANVVGHFRGTLASWDVVNEALNDGSGTLRPGFWADHIGREYIEQAFRSARAADPTAQLFYNDYLIEGAGVKADSVYAMLRDLRARGVPVDGVGMQMHLSLGDVPSTLASNFARFAALGLRIHITELEVRMPIPSTPASLATQAANYRAVYDVCLKEPACDMIVTWGFTDRASWVPGSFPGLGDALPFDANFAKKPAYTAVHDLLAGK